MTVALAFISLYAIVVTWLHVHQATAIDALMKKCARSDGQFKAADAELNALAVKHGQTLMELEDALRDAGRNIIRK